MDCSEETSLIDRSLREVDGVESVTFNLVAGTVTIQHHTSPGLLVETIRRAGFEVSQEGDSGQEKETRPVRFKLASTIASGLLTGVGGLSVLLSWGENVAIAAYLLAIVSGGAPIVRRGVIALRHRSLDMNILMGIAVIGAVAIGEWSEGAMVIFLFSVANLLESYSLQRTRKAIRSLMTLSPAGAHVKSVDGEEWRPVEQVAVGETIVVRPGERIALDGVVVQGHSSVNQAPITGESIPVERVVGDTVYAGTINQQGALEVEVTRPSSDTTLARIIRMVEEAQSKKAPSQRFVDRFATVYTPAVLIGAVGVTVIPPLVFGAPFVPWFYRALVLLVISCPCALVISTPVSIVSGLAGAARRGILMKGGVYLEQIGKLRAIAFDKTGTVTEGRPRANEVIPMNGASREDVLRIAASIELRSEHHVAQAIIEQATTEGIRPLPVEAFRAIVGRGVEGEIDGRRYYVGNHVFFEEKGLCALDVEEVLSRLEAAGKTTVLVGDTGKTIGIVSVSDGTRPEARATIEALRADGIGGIVMVTGDSRGTAEAIAHQIGLGVDEYRAGLLPEEKVHVIDELVERYGNAGMVGDGINDAPALARATVGIAMGTAGTDVALETADVALMGDDLGKLTDAIRLSRKTLAVIKQNIAFALITKVIFLALAIPGWATLWMAVAADMGASLIVIGNGLRVVKA
jgi:Cd2+/Zn2+-exporting ATPase